MQGEDTGQRHGVVSKTKICSLRKNQLRQEARDKPCQIRIPGVCNGNPETTVLCHLNSGGMGMKASDLAAGAWGCSSCHDAIDGRIMTEHPRDTLLLWHLEGVVRTLSILESEGIIGVIRKN